MSILGQVHYSGSRKAERADRRYPNQTICWIANSVSDYGSYQSNNWIANSVS